MTRHSPLTNAICEFESSDFFSKLDRNGRGTIISVIRIWWLFFFQFTWIPLFFARKFTGNVLETAFKIPWDYSLLIFGMYPVLRYLGYHMQCNYMGMSGKYCIEYGQVTPSKVRRILNVAGNRKEMEPIFLNRPAKPFYFLAHCYVRGDGDDGVAMILQLEDQKISRWGWNFFFWQDAIKGASFIWPGGLYFMGAYFTELPHEKILDYLIRVLLERPFHYLWEAMHLQFSMATLASLHVLLVEAIILFGWGSLLYEFWLRRTRNFAMPEGYLLLPEPKRIPEPKFVILGPPKKPKVKSPEDNEPPPAPFFPKPKRQRTKKSKPADATSETPSSEPPPSAPIPPDQWKNWD